MYFSIQIFACFLVTEPQPNPELLPTSRQAESEEEEDKVSVTENWEQKLNQSTLSFLIYLTPGRQDPDGRGDWGELCHPQRGAQKEGAVHALAHQVHHASLEYLEYLHFMFTAQVLGGADHSVCVRVLQGVWSGNCSALIGQCPLMLASHWSDLHP